MALEKGLMNCAVLEGPPEETILVHGIVLVRQLPKTGLVGFKILVEEKNGFTEDEIDYRLNKLAVAPSLQKGEDSLSIFRCVCEVLAGEGTPLIMLLLGESEQTEREMVVIYVANGITTARALTTLRTLYQQYQKANENKRQS